MNLADAWITNSRATANDVGPHCLRPLYVIPNGIDIAEFDRELVSGREKAKSLLLATTYHVGMFGGINPWKRQADFVNVAIQILRWRKDTSFYLVGAEVDQAYVSELQRRIREAGISRHIVLLGHIDCVPSFLEQMHVVMHTMPDESFGRIFIEAMAARRPVIAFDSGGASEIVVHNQTGLLVQRGDVERMAIELNRLLGDSTLRTKFGEAGRARLQMEYPIERHCRSMAAMYQEVAGAHPSTG